MEYASNGDLAQMIDIHRKNEMNIDETVIWMIMLQSLKALNTLHKMKVTHRDVKPANLFLSSTNTIKLGDLNVSKQS